MATTSGQLGQDPAYLAFLRAIGAEDSDLTGATHDQIVNISNELDRRRQELYDQNQQNLQDITNSYAARGLLNSGARQEALTKAQEAATKAAMNVEGAAKDQVDALNNALYRRRDDIARRRADYDINTASGLSSDGLYG